MLLQGLYFFTLIYISTTPCAKVNATVNISPIVLKNVVINGVIVNVIVNATVNVIVNNIRKIANHYVKNPMLNNHLYGRRK